MDIDDAEYQYFGGFVGNTLWVGQKGETIWMPKICASENIYSYGDVTVVGDLHCLGTKSRVASTKNFDQKKLYCYEMASPMFGDAGTAYMDERGTCYVSTEPVFKETIETYQEPVILLTKYGPGDIWIEEVTPDYFVSSITEIGRAHV